MKQYKALVDMSLRKSPDPNNPFFEEWHDWKAGNTFTPPAHMDVKRALARGIIKKVKGDGY